MLGASKPEFQYVRCTNHQHMTKIFQFLQKKLGMSAGYSTFLDASIQNECVDMEIDQVLVDESTHLGPNYLTNSEIYNKTQNSWRLEVYSMLLRSWLKIF